MQTLLFLFYLVCSHRTDQSVADVKNSCRIGKKDEGMEGGGRGCNATWHFLFCLEIQLLMERKGGGVVRTWLFLLSSHGLPFISPFLLSHPVPFAHFAILSPYPVNVAAIPCCLKRDEAEHCNYAFILAAAVRLFTCSLASWSIFTF